MSVQFSINLWIVAAIICMVLGLLLASFGMVAASDAEGRGGSFVLFIPFGLIVFALGLLYCLYRLGAVFGFWS